MAVQALLIYVWLTDLSALAGTDTYYSVYLLCGTAVPVGQPEGRKEPPGPVGIRGAVLPRRDTGQPRNLRTSFHAEPAEFRHGPAGRLLRGVPDSPVYAEKTAAAG